MFLRFWVGVEPAADGRYGFFPAGIQNQGKRADTSVVHLDLLKTATVKPRYTEETACLHLVLVGDLKSTTIAEIHRDLRIILQHEYVFLLKINVVELDISSAGIVDSLGLNLLLSVIKWAGTSNAEACIIVESRGVYETLLAIGLDKHAQLIYRE
jgi:ABC-type transporter Mla MlaB component